MAKPARQLRAHGLLIASLAIPMTIRAAPADSTAPSPVLLPAGQTLAAVADNPYFAIGLKAISEGLGTLTLALDAAPVDTLSARINEAHLGLMASGWSLNSQSTVESGGTTTRVVLT